MDENRFTLRPARWDDMEAIAALVLDVLTADGDAVSAFTAQEIANYWKAEGFNHETDTWVVTTTDGRIVGYEEFEHRQAHAYFVGDGYVHPEFRGNGIGAAMLCALDERARREMQLADPDLRVYLRAGANANDANVRAMFEEAGYRVIRYHWSMEVNLTEAPRLKPFPAGIELRPFDKDSQDHLVFQAEDEAFRDHWGHVPGNFTNWKLRKIERDAFDPALWYIAWDGDQIAGYAQTRFRNGIGWVGNLGVRRPWRKRGLGEALLLHSFNEFYKRGMLRVGLGVDASNPTGATRLYQKVGMRVAVEDIIVEKEYRAGKELEGEE
jgi:mycothiol synthase